MAHFFLQFLIYFFLSPPRWCFLHRFVGDLFFFRPQNAYFFEQKHQLFHHVLSSSHWWWYWIDDLPAVKLFHFVWLIFGFLHWYINSNFFPKFFSTNFLKAEILSEKKTFFYHITSSFKLFPFGIPFRKFFSCIFDVAVVSFFDFR